MPHPTRKIEHKRCCLSGGRVSQAPSVGRGTIPSRSNAHSYLTQKVQPLALYNIDRESLLSDVKKRRPLLEEREITFEALDVFEASKSTMQSRSRPTSYAWCSALHISCTFLFV